METSASLIGGLEFENILCLLCAASMRSVCNMTTNKKLLIEHSIINISEVKHSYNVELDWKFKSNTDNSYV